MWQGSKEERIINNNAFLQECIYQLLRARYPMENPEKLLEKAEEEVEKRRSYWMARLRPEANL